VSDAIRFRVFAAPTAKDGVKAIRGATHQSKRRVAPLLAEMTNVMARRQPFGWVKLRMAPHDWRGRSDADALKIINGVSDIIQRRHQRPEHAYDVWIREDDVARRESQYSEKRADSDTYEVAISCLEQA